MRQYLGRRLEECPPHVYSIAEAAMADVRDFRQNQAIVISGESGAGKTESTRLILQYFTTMAPSSNNGSASTMNQQIFHASTVLESFGNAFAGKTAACNVLQGTPKRFVTPIQVGSESLCKCTWMPKIKLWAHPFGYFFWRRAEWFDLEIPNGTTTFSTR